MKVLSRDPILNQTLAQVRIVTGRPHQIRIHMAWLGYPLVRRGSSCQLGRMLLAVADHWSLVHCVMLALNRLATHFINVEASLGSQMRPLVEKFRFLQIPDIICTHGGLSLTIQVLRTDACALWRTPCPHCFNRPAMMRAVAMTVVVIPCLSAIEA